MTVISIRNISKMYPLYDDPRDRLKQSLWYALPQFLRGKPRQFYREFWALHENSFEVKKGETVGIIGRNGSGKSTLLQIIAGTLAPTAGEVHVQGRVAALLELGSGFNPEFTGRENVYLNGSILGLSREDMEQRFDGIAAFADIGEFIDQPIKLYSSGMLVRLAFAVAISVDPDVFIIDEALAVGDARFQLACYERLHKMLEAGTTLLFVSHDGNAIKQLCSQAIVLETGKKLFEGKPNDALNFYSKLLFPGKPIQIEANETLAPSYSPSASEQSNPSFQEAQALTNSKFIHIGPEATPHEYRYGSHRGKITQIVLLNQNGQPSLVFETGERVVVHFVVEAAADICQPILAMTIKNDKGLEIYGTNTLYQNIQTPPLKTGDQLNLEFVQDMNIMAGNYFISLGFIEMVDNDLRPIDRRYDVIEFKVTPRDRSFGIANLQSQIVVTVREKVR